MFRNELHGRSLAEISTGPVLDAYFLRKKKYGALAFAKAPQQLDGEQCDAALERTSVDQLRLRRVARALFLRG